MEIKQSELQMFHSVLTWAASMIHRKETDWPISLNIWYLWVVKNFPLKTVLINLSIPTVVLTMLILNVNIRHFILKFKEDICQKGTAGCGVSFFNSELHTTPQEQAWQGNIIITGSYLISFISKIFFDSIKLR